jgi:glycosyltransferase involved in cell wall biosynthesis
MPAVNVSVIIITSNRAALVTKTIEAALAQHTAASYEVIVVDNNSTDDTWERVEAYGSRVQYVFTPTHGIEAARTAGIEIAQGKILAFIDDDCIPSPDWLEFLVHAFHEHQDAMYLGYGWVWGGPKKDTPVAPCETT